MFVILVLALAFSSAANAHTDKPHVSIHSAPSMPVVKATPSTQMLTEINAVYLQSVKAIFKQSCFNCHSSQTGYPWYAKLPGAKQLIESDIRESKEHLDITNDFPFGGHGDGPADDLQAIRDAVVNSDMPPWRYWMMHPSSRLNDTEKKAVTDWIDQSLKKLKNASPSD